MTWSQPNDFLTHAHIKQMTKKITQEEILAAVTIDQGRKSSNFWALIAHLMLLSSSSFFYINGNNTFLLFFFFFFSFSQQQFLTIITHVYIYNAVCKLEGWVMVALNASLYYFCFLFKPDSFFFFLLSTNTPCNVPSIYTYSL